MALKSPERQVHIVEMGGHGGVFQHATAAAVILASTHRRVTLHTSRDSEISDPRIDVCACVKWKARPSMLEKGGNLIRLLLATFPHLLLQKGVFWVQGQFRTPITLIIILLIRLLGKSVIFSPHNLFSRHGGRLDEGVLWACIRSANRVVAYNSRDASVLRNRKIDARAIPLFMYAPVISESKLAFWREELDKMGIVVCSVGQLRADKNLDMLVHAASKARTPLALMGQDTGARSQIESEIDRVGDKWATLYEGYYPLEDMAAVISLTGVVALPYSIVSQSGVAALAKAYGAKVIGCDRGGLSEQSDVIVASLDSDTWADALRLNVPEAMHLPLRVPKGATEADKAILEDLMSGVR